MCAGPNGRPVEQPTMRSGSCSPSGQSRGPSGTRCRPRGPAYRGHQRCTPTRCIVSALSRCDSTARPSAQNLRAGAAHRSAQRGRTRTIHLRARLAPRGAPYRAPTPPRARSVPARLAVAVRTATRTRRHLDAPLFVHRYTKPSHREASPQLSTHQDETDRPVVAWASHDPALQPSLRPPPVGPSRERGSARADHRGIKLAVDLRLPVASVGPVSAVHAVVATLAEKYVVPARAGQAVGPRAAPYSVGPVVSDDGVGIRRSDDVLEALERVRAPVLNGRSFHEVDDKVERPGERRRVRAAAAAHDVVSQEALDDVVPVVADQDVVLFRPEKVLDRLERVAPQVNGLSRAEICLDRGL